ncbi:MAG: Lar family restriction alleviation protein [Lachnospiraceae bacterium]|nr:Lar family restriction alleviation protein [Lachnospiraceae bacterium]
MSDTKLKPCAFCGGSPQTRMWSNGSFDVLCFKCGASTKIRKTEQEAIEVWNTRRPLERIVEQLEKERMFSKENAYGFFAERGNGEAAAFGKAIEIVQKGGAE